MIAIEIKNLSKKFGEVKALNGVNLQIKQGELFALLGLNGAGKTTLIKILSCLTKPSAGNATILGFDVTQKVDNVKQIIGISPQETSVAPLLSVRENLEFMCEIYGLKKEDANLRAEDLIKDFSLSEVADRNAGKLSGGYQRRLSIAMALVGKPKILFLDEPTLGLDVIARRELWNNIRSLKANTTMILTTHYLEEAEQLSDRIGIMSKGKMKIVGTPNEIIASLGKKNFEEAFISVASGGAL
ncbi:MAG: ATP-binding cassette domain-containing protein [Clostridia bacterium]|nr:ATP-binding cassette domain-containing protein [Clostridia bacterium]